MKIRTCALTLLLIFATLTAAGPASAESLNISGTGDSQALLRLLARAFEKQHAGTKIMVPESVGSGGGIKLLKKGEADLARTARPLKEEEKPGLTAHLFAYSPVVFAANPESGEVRNLSRKQIESLYAGRIVNWEELDGRTDHRIYLLHREPGDSSRRIIQRTIAAFKHRSAVARVVYSTPETAATLRDIPYTLGYLPLSMAREYGLVALAYEGVNPTPEAVKDGAYPMVTPFYLVSRGVPAGLGAEFIAFVRGRAAAEIMKEAGVTPAP